MKRGSYIAGFALTSTALLWASGASAQRLFELSPSIPVPQPGLSWETGAGRAGGPALRLAPATPEPLEIRLSPAPYPLPSPGRYRFDAWARPAPGAVLRVEMTVLKAASAAEVERRALEFHGGPEETWQYRAQDLLLEQDEALLYDLRLSAEGGGVQVCDLALTGAASILPHGRFSEVERGFDAAAGPPRGWRRYYAGTEAAADRAQGEFNLRAGGNGNELLVSKGFGSLVLSAKPLGIPDDAVSFVIEVYVSDSPNVVPAVELRQYGNQGVIDTSYSTGIIKRHPDATRLLLLLHFPQDAGEYRVKAVELVPFAREDDTIAVFTNQVGYPAGTPLRFLVSTKRFPSSGQGTFILCDGQGERYTGPLTPLGRAAGQGGSDWGSYYFEGRVDSPTSGAYELAVAMDDRTAAAPDVVVSEKRWLRETGKLAYRFYSVQRCGCVVPGWHGLCHMDDARLPDGTHVDVTGGYHNAGDFHKHMDDNTPVSAYGMVAAYGNAPDFFDAIDADRNGRADILDEALWAAAWLRKMVDPKTGHIWMNVTNDIDYYGIPERDTDQIVGTGDDRVISTSDPGSLGAFTMAAWARLSMYTGDGAWLEAAENLWQVYEERIVTGWNPRHIFAALELHETTGESAYLEAADRIVENLLKVQSPEGWFPHAPGGGPAFRIVDEGTMPAGLAYYAAECPSTPRANAVKEALRRYFQWSFRMAENPFGIIRGYAGGEPCFFAGRDDWFGGSNGMYLSVAWAARLAAEVFADEPEYAWRLRAHAANQVHWVLGMNPLDLCMLEGKGSSSRIRYHHLYAEIPGHPRGAVPGCIPNGITREPGNADRPWFDFREEGGTQPDAESAEPWLPHNAYYLLMLSAGG